MNRSGRRTTGARAASRKRTTSARRRARVLRPSAGRRGVGRERDGLTVPVAVVEEEVAVTEITFGGSPAAIVSTVDGEEAEDIED